MINLLASAITRPIDLAKTEAIIDLGATRGKAFLVHMFTRNGRLSFVLEKGSAACPPVVYQHDKYLLILSEAAVFTIDITDITAGCTTIPIHFPTQAARAVEGGVVIIHDLGCTMLTPDLKDVTWVIDDPRILTTRVDRGELRVFFGEHQGCLIDLSTGLETIAETPTVLTEDEDEDFDIGEDSNVIKLSSRFKC
jgi:hypothetical protein